MFGAAANTGGGAFGATNTGGAFGSTPGAGGFGAAAPATGGLFGGQAAAPTSTFGAQSTGGGLFGGTPANTGTFGATPGAFGATASTTNAFGQQNPAASPSASTFGGGFGGGNTTQPQANSSQYNPNNDLELPAAAAPKDTVSSIKFASNSNLMLVGSWDNSVRCYDVQTTANGHAQAVVPKAMIQHEQPVADVAFKGDGSGSFSASYDGQIKWWPFTASEGQLIGQHDGPVRHIRWIEDKQILVTGSMDKTLRYWDLRQSTAAMTVQLPERVFAMDASSPMVVVALGSSHPQLDQREVQVFDMNKPQQPFITMSKKQNDQIPLKQQYRSIAIFADKSGFALGSVEGRVAIQYVNAQQTTNNFAFKCHRDKTRNLIYSVNSINFHPVHGTFATTGSDGIYHFWDKDSKQRLHMSKRCTYGGTPDTPAAITASGFNHNGAMFAYAIGYDWSMGHENYNPGRSTNVIMIHNPEPAEVLKRPKR